MTLDKLYTQLNNTEFPIRNREELIRQLGNIIVEHNNHTYNARDIGMMIKSYPIKDISKLIEMFLNITSTEYTDINIAKEFAQLF